MMPSVLRGRLAQQTVRQWMRMEWFLGPLQPILHPSTQRLWSLGLFLAIGQVLFAVVWSVWLPQPYENLPLRVAASLLGCSLMLPVINRDPDRSLSRIVFGLVFWLELPVLFSWMYLSNGGSAVWLASMGLMVLIYYSVTDWRLATLGTVSGLLLGATLFRWFGITPGWLEGATGEGLQMHAVVFGFSWGCALVLSLSSANLQREQLNNTLSSMGIMAHELRTPLSTVSLIGDALHQEAQRMAEPGMQDQVNKLTERLHQLVRNMNHQIDTQIANARLLQLPRQGQRVSAAQLVRDVIANYPYQSSRHQRCVRVLVQEDFCFDGSLAQFSQVLDNLIKNAIYSLMVADSKFHHGALRIKVGKAGRHGQIVVADDGMGIEASRLSQVFKPFFSTNRSTGHGLGLAFCQRVVQAAGGRIYARSEYAVGATFTIELPVLAPAPSQTPQNP